MASQKLKVIHAICRMVEIGAQCAVPIMPLILSCLFVDRKYVRDYRLWVGRLKVHVNELTKGPIRHYLADVLMQHQNIPVQIQGECIQCGNCCLNKKCAFLVKAAEETYQCGIYSSRWRKFSNCNSFPLHGHDIERYQCPSYSVVSIFPARTSQPVRDGECSPNFAREQVS